MDAALLLFALLAAGALILALFRNRGGTPPSDGLLHVHDPLRISVQSQSKTFSLDDLPPELQAEGQELAQLSLRAGAHGENLSAAEQERMFELVKKVAAAAPESSNAPAVAHGDDGIKLMHVETRSSFHAEPSIWDETP